MSGGMRLVTCLVLLCAVLPALASAQGTPRPYSISGTVTDPSGAGIPNADVRVRQRGTSDGAAGTQTDNFGNFQVSGPPTGSIEINVSHEGFASETVLIAIKDRAPLEGHPVTSRSPVVLFGQRIRLAYRFQLADMDIESPELPGCLSLRLDVYSPPQVLQIDGRLCHLVLAFLVVGDVTNSRAPSLHGRYPASTLLRTHPSPSRLRSTSRLSRLYDLPCSDDFSSGRGGLLQLLGMSLSPCCRFHPAEVLEPHRSDFGSPCCLRPPVGGSAFGATHFRGHFCVHCCYGPVTRRLPTGDVVDRLQSFWFPATLLSKLRGSDFCPGRPFSC